MSKHEPRAAIIKTEAAKCGFAISWSLRKARLYAHITFPESHIGDYHHNRPMYLAPVEYDKVRKFLLRWYKTPEVTSWGTIKGTFMVVDLWAALGGRTE